MSGPAEPREGLTLRSRRGEVARTWWSRRFVQVLESLGMGDRLESGRACARSGQVLSLSLSTSVVVSLVQGSQPQPHRARIGIRSFTGAEWERIERALAERALYAAKLLAGEMPPEIEDLFARLGLQLFPRTGYELTMDCTCPDWQVPCKHLAATCHLLAESFDADPFEILSWRGRTRDDLLDRLRELRGDPGGTAGLDTAEPDAVQPAGTPPLADRVDAFWESPGTPPAVTSVPRRPDALLDQLDPLPFSVDGRSVTDLLRPAYRLLGDS
ncbi:SWIM zinc finger family protein [Umezawaea beigongshangensis]|uniref:SWIM zinc finger family protein n=1 Tax=Umezawaea beigongshangensis TaxID=2780383 RepID=UPI0018F18E5B|nr:hypothetical protein [Umezawaea beigongshangensis]